MRRNNLIDMITEAVIEQITEKKVENNPQKTKKIKQTRRTSKT